MALLELSGISKSFGPIKALSDVDFAVGRGEIVGLMGDNGAGKSTMVKLIAGNFPPSAGRIVLDGEAMQFRTPADARAAGIETIYQDLALCDNLSAADNIFLGREIVTRRLGVFPGVDNRTMRERAKTVLDELHIRIPDLDAPVRQLSGGQRQAVAISRAVYWQARLMIMDEPTAALGVPEQRKVMALIQMLKGRGVPVILISHNMQDVFEIADRIFVMRRGRNVGDFRVGDVKPSDVVNLMIGS